MGVPKFFRWVVDRYPNILSGIVRPPSDGDTENDPFVDNLYFDMNGIIHQCSHTDAHASEALSFQIIMEKICLEIVRIFTLVRPQKLMYIAIDGVAPRAKLNQQRSRRFRTARDRMKAIESALDGNSPIENPFDSNCITPGTEFMTNVSLALRAFITHMMQTDPLWKKIQVIFSGSEVPGEGEHKLISYIREARRAVDYAPNVRHCVLGADADMIMLALATHEPFFLVMREKLTPGGAPGGSGGRNYQNNRFSRPGSSSAPILKQKAMNYVRINVLREYIIQELLEDLEEDHLLPERILDDFVFLTFLVGNDFLPHLPAINIGDQAFDIIFDAYKTVLSSEPGYLVDNGTLDVARLEIIFALIGVTEKSLYYEQQQLAQAKRERYLAKKNAEQQQRQPSGADRAEEAEGAGGVADTFISLPAATSLLTAENVTDREDACKREYYQTKFGFDIATKEGQQALARVVAAYLEGLHWCLNYYTRGCISWGWYYPYHYGPFLHDMVNLSDIAATGAVQRAQCGTVTQDSTHDTATVHTSERIDSSLPAVPSPSPFPSSLHLDLGQPLTPFQQLLACLPASSCKLLPAPYHWLMTDTLSPLFDYYPTLFATDLNGKKKEYEAVVILPFIDKHKLVTAESQYCSIDELTATELDRNKFGVSYKYSLRPTMTSSSGGSGSGDGITVTTTGNSIANNTRVVSTSQLQSTLPESPTFLDIVEILPSIHPSSESFAPVLVPGTVDSLPHFPSFQSLQERVDYRHGYGGGGRGRGGQGGGGGKKGKRNVRTRSNCYSDAMGPDSTSLPMPGVPSSSPVCPVSNSNPVSVVGSTTTTTTTAAAAVEVPTTSISLQDTSMNAQSPLTVTFGLVVDNAKDPTLELFLRALASQVEQQTSQFKSFLSPPPTPSTGANTGSATATSSIFEPLEISMSLTDAVGLAHVDTCVEKIFPEWHRNQQRLQQAGAPQASLKEMTQISDSSSSSSHPPSTSRLSSLLLERVGTIFGPVTCQLLPVSVVHIDGTVGIKFTDVSHLAQIEQFLSQRLLGNDVIRAAEASAGSTGASIGIFVRSIVIGSYAGEDVDRFLRWFNGQLQQLARHLPRFVCSELQCRVRNEKQEGVEDINANAVNTTHATHAQAHATASSDSGSGHSKDTCWDAFCSYRLEGRVD